MESILSSPFDGATGTVEFGERRFVGNRKRETLTYGVYNFRPILPSEQIQDPDLT